MPPPQPQAEQHIASSPEARKPQGFASTQASLLLDIVRGLAAFLVLFDHWRNIFFLDYPQIPAHRFLFALPWLLASAGHQSVIIFFVLSGYLISGSVFRMFQTHRWSWRTYLLHRGVRLWIVLLPGLLFAALFDGFGMHLHRAPAIALYSGLSGDHVLGAPVQTHISLLTWLGNLFFLQTSLVPVFGSDGPLWSLANEFWYYILFPCALLAVRCTSTLPVRLISVALIAAICLLLNPEILALFPVWLLGTVLALIPPPLLSTAFRTLAAILYVPSIFFFSKLRTTHGLLADWTFGLLTFAFLYVLLSARHPAPETNLPTRLWRTLARFSYTLYVVHLPLLFLIAALILPSIRWTPDLPHLALATLILASAIAFSYALASLTEFRTDQLRRAIERRLP